MLPEQSGTIGEDGLPDRMRIKRVLLVDDDPAVRGSLQFAFELQGFSVEAFASAEALAEGQVVNDDSCLVLDHRLPGMSGLDLLSLLRSRGSRAPAIIITSNPTRSLRQQIAAARAVLVEKPLLCDALSATIHALGRRQGCAIN